MYFLKSVVVLSSHFLHPVPIYSPAYKTVHHSMPTKNEFNSASCQMEPVFCVLCFSKENKQTRAYDVT